MALVLIAPDRDMSPWADALEAIDPNLDIDIWPNIDDHQKVQFAVCWNQPKHVLDQFPNLKAVSSLGAGVDHLINDEALPKSVAICRVVATSLVQQMKEYILGAVINSQRNFVKYLRQQDAGKWQPHNHPLAKDLQIGVMGLGKLGRPVAHQLVQLGYNVSGWSRSPKELSDITTFAGKDQLSSFLNGIQILICLLPLTEETKDILDLNLFKQLDNNAWIINVARGAHLVEEDLIYALDTNILQGAWLDVFREEPLPDKHAFWNRENIIITPHVASITKPTEVADQIVDNYKRVLSGMAPNNLIDPQKGY
jgi:glyoxylate/hydroxypyruvate reductase A